MSTSPTAVPEEASIDSLRDAFSQSHNAVQWLARMVRSFRSVNAGEDVALHWDDERKAFVTDEFAEGLKMELRLPELTLQFLEHGQPVKHELQMEGRSPAQVEAWLLVELLHRGLDRSRFSKDLPYDIPNAMAGDNVEYSPEFREGELKKILAWFTAAADLLKNIARKSSGKDDDPSRLTLRTKDFSLDASVALLGQAQPSPGDRQICVRFYPLRAGAVDPHYLVSRTEPTATAPDIFEIIKVSGTTADEIAGAKVAKKIADAVAKLQKLAAQ
ncbi:hypothetical protein DLM45_05120 [Hyphomicrobium methylovorum]|uniref:hypothetical protein n=1 Tax=Hyphomicrobium methylovorum TaxID=84 RepID=UPI0015E78B23|nr:hypothetical protein [Hyphomicrobium methylovorum]MBA2125605.1 hypothetical protein [Hyphomicrobium methylovorum]